MPRLIRDCTVEVVWSSEKTGAWSCLFWRDCIYVGFVDVKQ